MDRGIEMDLLVPHLSLNIEIDGPFHSQSLRQPADRARDDFLQSHGLVTRRIDAVALDYDVQRIARAVRKIIHSHAAAGT